MTNTPTDSIPDDSRSIADACVCVCEERLATDVRLYDVSKTSLLADYYLICTGNSDPHIRAIAGEIEKALKERGLYASQVEGVPASHWMILDYGVVMIHIFHPDTRKYYCLEELWPEDAVVYSSEDVPR